jgi:predicted GNAT superfamily acetyltransferase
MADLTRYAEHRSAARTDADNAAARSGVTIRPAAGLEDVQVARLVADAVWQPPPGDPAIVESMLWPMTHVGNYCSVAYDGAFPIGVCIGFLGLHPAYSVHSHAAGVTAAGMGRSIGFALKLDQRAWALERGIGLITWTYDPLVRRNGFFNLTKLGARPVEYDVDFYGEMSDAINVGQGSDRLMVGWDLATEDTALRASRQGPEPDLAALHSAGARVVVADDGGRPVVREPVPGAGSASDVLLVQVPPDIEGLRASDPALAREWRTVIRETLPPLLAGGWAMTAMTREGHYVLRSNR